MQKAEKGDLVADALSKAAPYWEEDSKLNDGFGLVLTNEELEATFKTLEGHIYGKAEEAELSNSKPENEAAVDEADIIMDDAPVETPQENQESQEAQVAEETENTAEAQETEEAKETVEEAKADEAKEVS